MKRSPLRILLVEDSVSDADLIVRELERSGLAAEFTRAETMPDLRDRLAKGNYDMAITDHELRGFDSTDVLELLADQAPDLPCLLVSGKVGEETVGQAMRQGAVDYVSKDSLGTLTAVVERTVHERKLKHEATLAEEALARSGRLFEAVFANARDTILIVDGVGHVIDANPAAAELFAVARNELIALSVEDLVPATGPDDAPHHWAELDNPEQTRGELELLRPDGSLVPVEYTVAANFLPNRHIIVIRDIRERRAAEAAVRRRVVQQEVIVELSERALREKSINALMSAVVMRLAATLGVEIVSILELREEEHAFVVCSETAPGQPRAEAKFPNGPEFNSLASFTMQRENAVVVEDYREESRFERSPLMEDRGIQSAVSVEILGQRRPFGVLQAASTRPRAFDLHDASFLAAVARLLADAVERSRGEDEIRERSLHDALTGLPNRTLFFDRLALGLARTKRTGVKLAVLFIDVDRFKGFNDTRGHLAADELLTQVGERTKQTMRETDTVARFGGDEFVVICEDLADVSDVAVLTKRLLRALAAPFSIDDEKHSLTASVGVALSAEGSSDAEALVRAADIAMYRSKEQGGGMWTLASEELLGAAVDRVETKRTLERAIATDELRLDYQPIVALAEGEMCAVEALVRWEHPERGLIPPDQFIPLAEESSLILSLGEWVLRDACKQAAQWRAELGEAAPLPIHINLAARQVAQPDLPEIVRVILAETGVSSCDIALEITETALIDELREPIAVLEDLQQMGVAIVLDDFGTGYSSLSYLDRFPIDTLKIDRAFVAQLDSEAASAPIITAILGMARAMAVGAVAEGVETAEQSAAIQALGCEHAQGYFFARPTSADQITALVRDDSPLRARAAEASALDDPDRDPQSDASTDGRARADAAGHRRIYPRRSALARLKKSPGRPSAK